MTTQGREELAESEGRAVLANTAAWSTSHSLFITDLGERLLEEVGLT